MLPSQELQNKITQNASLNIIASGIHSGDFWIQVPPEKLHETIVFLRDDPDLAFDGFVDLCGVDYLPRSPRFESVIHLFSSTHKHRIRIRVTVPEKTLTVPSITKFWKGANWQERESFDMYGIRYEGHPNLTRILSPPGATEHPQRRDYPLKGHRQEKEDL